MTGGGIGASVQLVMKKDPTWLDFKHAYRYSFVGADSRRRRVPLWHAVASPHCALSCPMKSARSWPAGSGRPPLPQGWPLGTPRPPVRSSLASNGVSVRTWAKRFLVQRLEGLYDVPGRGAKGIFSQSSPFMWRAWPASDQIPWDAASPSGIAKSWRATSSRGPR
jgi:hypothetical protein